MIFVISCNSTYILYQKQRLLRYSRCSFLSENILQFILKAFSFLVILIAHRGVEFPDQLLLLIVQVLWYLDDDADELVAKLNEYFSNK